MNFFVSHIYASDEPLYQARYYVSALSWSSGFANNSCSAGAVCTGVACSASYDRMKRLHQPKLCRVLLIIILNKIMIQVSAHSIVWSLFEHSRLGVVHLVGAQYMWVDSSGHLSPLVSSVTKILIKIESPSLNAHYSSSSMKKAVELACMATVWRAPAECPDFPPADPRLECNLPNFGLGFWRIL